MAKIDIDGDAKKTTANLLSQIAKATTNPSIVAIQKLEKNRIALMNKSVAQWNEPSTLKMIKNFENTVKASSQAFTSIQDFQKYTEPLITSLGLKHLEEARKSMIDLPSHYKQSSLIASSSIKEIQKALNSSSVQSALPKLRELSYIQDSIKRATESIAIDKSMMEATKSLRDASKSIVSDSFQKKIEDNRLANIQYEPLNIPHFEIPENPLIAQNNKLIEVSNLQNNILNDISEFMRLQNDAINNQLEELKLQNKKIEKQILQREVEIDKNTKSTRNTLFLAITGIFISILVTAFSIWVTYDVYKKEKVENNQDNKVLIEAISDKTTQNKQLSLLVKEMKQQNKLLQEQNTYLKNLSKKQMRQLND